MIGWAAVAQCVLSVHSGERYGPKPGTEEERTLFKRYVNELETSVKWVWCLDYLGKLYGDKFSTECASQKK